MAGTSSAIVSTDYPLSAAALPGGAGTYTLSATYQSSNSNYSGATGAVSLTVLREAASMTFGAPYYVTIGTSPSLAVNVDQRDPAGLGSEYARAPRGLGRGRPLALPRMGQAAR